MPFGVVLIADDEPMVRQYLRSILSAAGWQTIEAANGKEGLASVQDAAGRLDAIVSDIQMPGGDGINFVRAIGECFPRIPCILISGVVLIDPAVNVRFLRKPFTPAQLLETLRSAMADAPRVMKAAGEHRDIHGD